MPDGRVMSSGPDFGTSKGRGQKSDLCPLRQRPIGSFFRIKNPFVTGFVWLAASSTSHPLLFPH